MKKKQFIINIHIQKTAGTTFHHILRKNILFYLTLNNHLFWEEYNGILKYEMFSKLIKKLPFINGIGGHTLRRVNDYEKLLTNRDVKYITFLREPVSRYISQFNYGRIQRNTKYDFESYLEIESYKNFQTKKIAGCENITLAREMLDKDFEFVGIVEDFKTSLRLLQTKLPGIIKHIDYKKNKNITPADGDRVIFYNLANNIKTRVLENNKLDLQLYEYALDCHKYEKSKLITTNLGCNKIPCLVISFSNFVLKILFENFLIKFCLE